MKIVLLLWIAILRVLVCACLNTFILARCTHIAWFVNCLSTLAVTFNTVVLITYAKDCSFPLHNNIARVNRYLL